MTQKHYVDNKQFLDILVAYKKDCRIAKKNKKPNPPIPSYIGECFSKIADNYSHRKEFIKYSYRDEMVSDAVENCLLYFGNFDPKITKNPFAYFSQVVYFAFLRRIEKEHKQQYIKYKYFSNYGVETTPDDDESKSPMSYENINEFIKRYEDKIEQKKLKTKNRKKVKKKRKK